MAAKHPVKFDAKRGPKCSCKLQSGRKLKFDAHQPACARRLWLEASEALDTLRAVAARVVGKIEYDTGSSRGAGEATSGIVGVYWHAAEWAEIVRLLTPYNPEPGDRP